VWIISTFGQHAAADRKRRAKTGYPVNAFFQLGVKNWLPHFTKQATPSERIPRRYPAEMDHTTPQTNKSNALVTIACASSEGRRGSTIFVAFSHYNTYTALQKIEMRFPTYQRCGVIGSCQRRFAPKTPRLTYGSIITYVSSLSSLFWGVFRGDIT